MNDSTDTIGNDTTAQQTGSGWFGNILGNISQIGQTATGVIGAIKSGSKSPTPNTKAPTGIAGMSTQTIILIAAGGLTVLLVVMMFLRRK